jgi:hypothetical protein
MSNVPIEPIPPVRLNQPRPPPIAEGDTMERLFQALFYRIAVLYARAIPKHIRRLGETALLVMVKINKRKTKKIIFKIFQAIICMSLLIYLHVVFNQKPITCLSHLHDNWPKQGVLRVELFFEPPPKDYDLQQSYAKEFQYHYEDNELNNSLLILNEPVRNI